MWRKPTVSLEVREESERSFAREREARVGMKNGERRGRERVGMKNGGRKKSAP